MDVRTGSAVCPDCGAAAPDGTRFCGQCGRELPAVEPALAPAVPMSRRTWRGLAVFSVLVTALFVVAFLQMDPNGSQQSRSETSTAAPVAALTSGTPDRTVKLDCYCSPSLSDAGQVYLALQRSDTAAVIGLVSRGKVFALAPGDRVKVITTSDAMARVRVLTGYRIGERCWMLSGLLE